MGEDASGRRTKVERVIDDYGLDEWDARLEAEWIGDGTERRSLRDPAAAFNRAVVRAALDDAGESVSDADVDHLYRTLTDDAVPRSDAVRKRRDLEDRLALIEDELERREDRIEHLSESEREVTGLIFALAVFLVHEAHETVPFVLLDSPEAIDTDRIAALVDYFEEYVDYLVVALLREDAEALPETYAYVTEI
ncbi:hypothetical protein Htur_2324 [Haloterrigena turkmenica DSM 5511]|uniref:Uncharacterized protein n=1 Tax=Haloterrigena turkmenica (strain ATCC 51198 / DSM 5511 / JCM 9101 / NCIMB 13204 / VKM B-1734 / 4k) TaxID=543526 RepID=D2RUN2_HALTV|nr:hypothetical protein Htur_2324 [Haloterrigena turkmenica DSM 5511]